MRLRSYPFWVAVFGFIGLFLSDIGVIDIGSYQVYMDSLLVILVSGGIIADPTTQGLSDSKQALNYKKPRKG